MINDQMKSAKVRRRLFSSKHENSSKYHIELDQRRLNQSNSLMQFVTLYVDNLNGSDVVFCLRNNRADAI